MSDEFIKKLKKIKSRVIKLKWMHDNDYNAKYQEVHPNYSAERWKIIKSNPEMHDRHNKIHNKASEEWLKRNPNYRKEWEEKNKEKLKCYRKKYREQKKKKPPLP